MKILWLVNIVMPELAVHLGEKPSVFGGWLTGALEAVRAAGHELTVCTIRETEQEVRYRADPRTTYLLCRDDEPDQLYRLFRNILEQERPDLVHIWGTEFAPSWALARAANPDRLLVTIQGSLEVIKDHARAGIPAKICRDTLLHKLLRRLHEGGQAIDLQVKSFAERAKFEVETLKRAAYIHGGSAWGNAVAKSIHPGCTTFDASLILRSSFYDAPLWSIDQCEAHTIYALCTYPVKGFHKLLEAMPAVLKRFPDAKILAPGQGLIRRPYTGLKKALMDAAPDYQWYLQGLMDRYALWDHVQFTGYLTEDRVQEQLRRAHVFVSPSSIENQSTALGEAMVLGVPSIASRVGAMEEMIHAGEDGFLYEFDDTDALAAHICRIFEDRELALQFSRKGRAHARRTYDREKNCRDLLHIYETIGGGDK